MIQFFAAGLPRPKGSMRAFVRGRHAVLTNDNAATKPWQDTIAWCARSARVPLASGPVSVGLVFYLPRPKSVKRLMPEVKPDIDKLTRAALDALTHIAWHDDSQVVELQASKLYAHDAPGPGVDVRIWTTNGGGSDG